uniref:Interleukin-4 n=1 Tax=Athene cunicularia TaxID=194338 RepID=A0A663MS27_ATHCN
MFLGAQGQALAPSGPCRSCSQPAQPAASHLQLWHITRWCKSCWGQLTEQELLCQAATALAKVEKCKKDYQPFIINLQSLHGQRNCSLSNENEIYLRNFLPELGNFTQGMYRRLAVLAAQ